MRTGQLGNYITVPASTGEMVRARDGGILGFYIAGATTGLTMGLYDVTTSASATAANAIIPLASVAPIRLPAWLGPSECRPLAP